MIPTLDEAEALPRLLGDLEALSVPHRVVVADGGSGDGTRAVARAAGATVLGAATGRARQLRAGAEAAVDAPWLLFLHADSRLPPRAREALARWLETAPPGRSAHFAFAVDASGPGWRLLEAGQRLRERATGLVYGDQGLLVSRATYEAVGGYPELPLMEDVAMVDRIRAAGPLDRLPATLPTSPRRYRRHGRVAGVARNALLAVLFRLGVPPRRLARLYPPRREPPRRVLLVFARAPRPGRVKTRLAADLGEERAAAVYRALGRGVVDRVRGGPWRTWIVHDPPDAAAAAEVEAWLGAEGLELHPQDPGDLGRRMERAFDRAFRAGARRVAVVGTDAPDVDAAHVGAALDALDDADVVLGPAADGGYWLLALARPRPELFRDVPWSTAQVLGVTRRRAAALGLRVRELEVLTDVDVAADLPPGWRLDR